MKVKALKALDRILESLNTIAEEGLVSRGFREGTALMVCNLLT